MIIIIKHKNYKVKKVYDNETLIDVNYVDVFFDVEDGENYYIDAKNYGYFPLEIEDNSYTDEELVQLCENWITANNILDIYKPTYTSLEEKLIEEKKMEILERQARDELGL